MSAPVAPGASVAPGDVLAGKFRVERILGKGGMGMVVAAVHLQLDKRVALKFLLPEMAQNPEIVQRFAREARAASRIESEHVAKVLDVGVMENGAPFMVMEYLEGADLAEVLKQRGGLPGQEAIEYVLQACEALAEAHVAGIVHRDLKPANLFLTKRADGSPCIKVLDFGISKIALAGDQEQGMTQTSALMGSPNYMAPEQLRSARNVDARTDIWSLGIILHELLTGDVAFKAETVPELYVSILQSPPIPLRSRRPDAPPAMEAIVSRCLEKDPARRFANVGELATALGELAPAQARLSIDRITRIVGTAARPSAGAAPAYVAGSTVPMPGGTPAPSYGPPTPQPNTPQSYAPPAPGTPGPGYAPNTPPPGYRAGPPAPTYTSQAGRAPPGAYGPGPAYGPPQQAYPPRGPAYGGPPPGPPKPSMSSATLTLIIIVAIVVLGGTCTMCMCIGAAGNQSNHHRRGDLGSVAAGQAVAVLDGGSATLRPFQRPAGWTTVSRGARSRPPPVPCSRSAWDAAWQAHAVSVSCGQRGRHARSGAGASGAGRAGESGSAS
jgi:serine/threonine-protein kinase